MIAAPTLNSLVTEDDLARARTDPEFRQQFLARNLEQLLEALSVRRKDRDSDSPEAARQIREGIALAVNLAERLQRNHFGTRAA